MPPRPRFPGKPERKDEHRINDFIRVPIVRLVDANGTMVGEVPTEQARKMAREAGLDLVEVAPDAKPPVCKIMDYGKFKFEERKRKKKHHSAELKEVRFRPRTGDHDFQTKLKKARGFLEEGHKVLFTIFFRGREMAHKELGRARMEQIKHQLDDIAKVEHELSMMGPRMHLTVMPKPGVKPKPKPPAGLSSEPPAGLSSEPPAGPSSEPPARPPSDGSGPAPVPAPVSPAPPAKEAQAPVPEPKENPNAQAQNK